MLQVRHILQVRPVETQDGEPARHRMAAPAEWDDLQGEIRPVGKAEQVLKLIEQDLPASYRPPQRGFLDDRPELDPPLGEPALPFLAEDDVPFGFADGDVAHG